MDDAKWRSWWEEFKASLRRSFTSTRVTYRQVHAPPPVVATDRCAECGSTDPDRHHPVCGVPRLGL